MGAQEVLANDQLALVPPNAMNPNPMVMVPGAREETFVTLPEVDFTQLQKTPVHITIQTAVPITAVVDDAKRGAAAQ